MTEKKTRAQWAEVLKREQELITREQYETEERTIMEKIRLAGQPRCELQPMPMSIAEQAHLRAIGFLKQK